MVPRLQKGFTLVELAIALMVIGLLIGGVLKGQELIENARITATMRQLKAYDAAALIFRNTYGALPGDIKRPNRIPNCTEEICTTAGDGNGRTQGSIEEHNFFPHLTKAGMIQGPEGGTADQMLAYDGADNIMNVQHETRGIFWPDLPIGGAIIHPDDSMTDSNRAYYVLTTTHKIKALDMKMDDGLPRTGIVRTEECATISDGTVYEYDMTASDYFCGTWIENGF